MPLWPKMPMSFKLTGWILAGALSAFAQPWASAQDAARGIAVWQKTIGPEDLPVRVAGISFSAKANTLRVADNPPDHAVKLAEAAQAAGALAGCNASYFHADGRPLGLVIADSKTIHSQERAKLLSGILAVRGNRIELVRAAEFRPGPEVSQAVQSGPWLVENGDAIEGLDASKRARRTVVATDGRGQWALIVFTSPTLADTARILADTSNLTGWKVRDALNLDGGGSTALWAADGFSLPEYGHVRNFLLVMPR